jgi:hypothetical protein
MSYALSANAVPAEQYLHTISNSPLQLPTSELLIKKQPANGKKTNCTPRQMAPVLTILRGNNARRRNKENKNALDAVFGKAEEIDAALLETPENAGGGKFR